MEKVQQAFQVQQNPSSDPAQIKEASVWLEHFQGTTEAWQVADQLLALHLDAANTAPHIFAAQTMRTKIQYDWNELPAAAHESLRSSLLTHVLRFGQVGLQPMPKLKKPQCTPFAIAVAHKIAELDEHACLISSACTCFQGPMPVLTQLCLAVGVLALHMESWDTVVTDLIQSLTTPPEQAAAKLPCLLELLTVLPEEAENYKVALSPVDSG